MNLDIVERMKICKFLYFIDINIQHFSEMCEISENIRRSLKLFAIVFGWLENESFSVYLDEFMCRNYVEFTKTEEIRNFYHLLTIGINNLEGS